MILLEIKKKGNSVKLLFDSNDELVVPYELYVQLSLYKNDNISKSKYEEFEAKVSIYIIKQSALRYLSGRNHSKNELKLKLLKKGYNKDQIDIVIEDLERINFLDDEEFTNQYYKIALRKKKGIGKIKSELYRKGVERNIIENVGENFIEDPIMLESALILTEKKLHSIRVKDYTNVQKKQKVFSYLSYRGFPTEIIKESLNKFGIN